MERIILFDGVCNLCNHSIQFIIKRDPNAVFKFASLQSDIGKELLKKHGLNEDTDSFVLIENNKSYIKSSAALRVCRKLKAPWNFFVLFFIVPRPVRDFIYDFIAKNRYRWFGKQESCMLPTPEIRKRFIE
ncbi:thiol-disulfide oxidoreductase [Pueribacillus theae]|uniref:Thiol-disulfide oxidoreductase n=1 Tax=Pueribacillus theae TaxID=2171751 RepID=A0A2U1K3I6_9BACI|nr:thiol-disulfide oxidoreductase DCC family protein [Pueribacillus theae]PWA11805.1 thiol-disulfide oxidoreductase [Pueribacillus theae]